jgi:hypothetical protein
MCEQRDERFPTSLPRGIGARLIQHRAEPISARWVAEQISRAGM